METRALQSVSAFFQQTHTLCLPPCLDVLDHRHFLKVLVLSCYQEFVMLLEISTTFVFLAITNTSVAMVIVDGSA